MRGVIALVLLTALTWTAHPVYADPAAAPGDDPCAEGEGDSAQGASVDLGSAAIDCQLELDDILHINTPSGVDVQVVPLPGCMATGSPACGLAACVTDAGHLGIRYFVLVDGKFSHEICYIPSDDEPSAITPSRVIHAFQRLEWPSSELIVQPPDGRTLVNFDTNFLTENTEPTRQRVRLLGQRIVIEAEPTSYVWVFGDGESLETESPGARYPDLLVTHQYLKKATYRPRVDTVYTGRYRVNGGPWVQIPETLTVEGAPVELEAIEATPLLVAPDGG